MKSTIKAGTEVSSLFAHGKRFSTPFLTVIVLEQQSQHDLDGRVAFIAGKKSGNAVWRNAAKRRMRALVHDLNGPWGGLDVAFVAKSSILKVPYSKVSGACAKALNKAGLAGSASEKMPADRSTKE